MNQNHAHTQAGRVTVRRDRMPTRLPWLVENTGDLYPTSTTVAAFTRHADAVDYARRYALHRHAERKAAADAYARHNRDMLAALKGTPLL